MTAPKTTEGLLDFEYPPAGKPLQTWYKITGDLAAAKRPPLICLHGGPGATHDYITPYEDIASSHGVPVILYDQVGNGRSTHLRDVSTTVLSEALFLAELDNLVVRLGIAEYDLLGHSWGGMLALRAAARQPRGLRRLVSVSAPVDMQLWVEAQNELKKGLPEDMQDALTRNEDAGTTESEEYKAVVEVFYKKHLCRIDPFPERMQATFKALDEDPTVYMYMNGPSEFHVVGTIKSWSVIDELHKITASTLLVNGRFDEAQDSTVAPAFARIPKVKWVTLENSSHTSQWEERERVMEIIGGFLTS